MEWQPIETAPKDGTWILGYSPSLKIAFYPAVVFWDAGWQSVRGEDEPYRLTHWMPLPAPPVAEGEGQ